jgi:glutathione reductase (NADPH)
VNSVRRLKGKGVDGQGVRIDWKELARFKRTFTEPAPASREKSFAKADGVRLRKTFQRTEGWYSSRRIGEARSAFKILIDENSDRIIGAHLFGDNADEMINLFTLAIRSNMRASDLQRIIFAYPTYASNVQYML